jgi:signal transduction histidine kinase
MRERAKQLRGTVDIWSRKNAGTEIEVRVPAATAYVNSSNRSGTSWLTRLIKTVRRGEYDPG